LLQNPRFLTALFWGYLEPFRRFMMKNLLGCLLIVGFFGGGVFAQAELDTTFNSTGIQTASFGIHASGGDIAIQPDNKIVITGSCQPSTYQQCVARYNEDGSLDTTFAQQGFLVNFGLDGGSRVALQSDGKIVVGGTKRFDSFPAYAYLPTLARYTPDGVLDSSFGGGNIIVGGAGLGLNTVTAMAIQPDGKILLVGDSRAWVFGWGTSTSSLGWVVRYLPDGTPDTSFGNGGVMNLSGTLQSSCDSVAVQPDGKILLSVSTSTGFNPPPPQMMLWRLNSNGTFDPTWGGGDGIVDIPAATFLVPLKSLNVMPDGRVVGMTDYRAIFRFNPDGSFDTSLDGDGIRELIETGVNTDLTVSASGKMTLTGPIPNSGAGFGIYKFKADGAVETGFGNNGRLIVSPISASDHSYSLSCAFDPHGRLVAAGYVNTTTPNRFVLVRLVAPPAMPVSVSGRVTDGDGNGVANATVSTQGSSAQTSPFGYYTLSNVETNRTYIFSVRARNSIGFTKRTILVDDNLTGIDFVGEQLTHRTIQTEEPAPRSLGPSIRKLR
jgi:uncharacterized delta-60 repeat protein